MNPNWRSFLESSGARFAGESNDVSDFGDAAAELQAAAKQTVVAPLVHLGLIEAFGEEAQAFLHSQFTSDINHLGEAQAQHAAWCSAKGRMQASFVVWRRGESYLLGVAADLQEATQKRLQMFILRAKVKLASRSDDIALIGISGPQGEAALAAAGLPCPAETMTSANSGDASVLRLEGSRWLVALPVDAATATWPKLASVARPVGTSAWRWLDIQQAFPLVTLATKEEFVPQMTDFEKIGGVSFHKGCYPGQEVVARTQYLGKVKRHLYRLTSETPLAAGNVLYSPDNPDQSCGMVMTAAPSPAGGYAALAVVQSNFAENVRLGALEGPAVQATAVNP